MPKKVAITNATPTIEDISTAYSHRKDTISAKKRF